MNTFYRLEGHRPVRCADLMEWALWYENLADRIVAKTHIGVLEVSTVFLGLDHNFSRYLPGGDRTPILFETMIFNGDEDDFYQVRCATWEEAEDNHRIAVMLATARHLGTKDQLAEVLAKAFIRADKAAPRQDAPDADIGFGRPDPQP